MNINNYYEEALITTSGLIKTLTKTFTAFIKGDVVDTHPAIFIKGEPGIGKSQAVLQIKENVEKLTNKRVVVKDIRLLLYSPLDLNGIPVPDLNKKKAVWLTPEIFDFDYNDDVVNILFLDELTSAPESIQAAAYQIALDKKLGEHKLPKNTFVIAAGNTEEDLSIINEMPTALKNRFIHFRLTVDVKEWLMWAKNKKINKKIRDFIKDNPSKLKTMEYDTESNIIVTPRSYEVLSNLLKPLKGSLKSNKVLIESVIGSTTTALLLKEETKKKFNINKIITSKVDEEVKDLSTTEEILTNLEISYNEYYEDKEKMENVLYFVSKLPTDFSLRFLKRILNTPPNSYNIFHINLFEDFMNKYSEIVKNE